MSPITNVVGQLTDYTNAVLVVLLPCVSDFVRKVGLEVQTPVTTGQVARLRLHGPDHPLGGTLLLTNRMFFGFLPAGVDSYESPVAGHKVPWPDTSGPVRLTRAEALALARGAITRLGYDLESLYADLDPEVEPPQRFGTNWVPSYRFQWYHPNEEDSRTADVTVDANRRTIEALALSGPSLFRPALEVPGWPVPPVPPSPPEPEQPAPAEDAATFLVQVLRDIDHTGEALGLPLVRSLTTNHVAKYRAKGRLRPPETQRQGQGLRPVPAFASMWGEVVLTNGWRFQHNFGYVEGFDAADIFFGPLEVRVREFAGKPRMSAVEAAALARQAVRKLGHDLGDVGMNRAPEVRRPRLQPTLTVPRLLLKWNAPGAPSRRFGEASFEIDTEHRTIKGMWLTDEKRITRVMEALKGQANPQTPVTNRASPAEPRDDKRPEP